MCFHDRGILRNLWPPRHYIKIDILRRVLTCCHKRLPFFEVIVLQVSEGNFWKNKNTCFHDRGTLCNPWPPRPYIKSVILQRVFDLLSQRIEVVRGACVASSHFTMCVWGSLFKKTRAHDRRPLRNPRPPWPYIKSYFTTCLLHVVFPECHFTTCVWHFEI